MSESMSWRRGFAAGFVALALSIGGQVATREAGMEAGTSCSLARMHAPHRYAERLPPRVESRGLAQRVALAVLGAVLHTCS
jgi:heme A synthase